MASLPTYHQISTDEKAPVDDFNYHPESTGLRLGGERSYVRIARTTKEKYQSLSKVKKTVVALGLVWVTLAAAHQAVGVAFHHGHDHGDRHRGMRPFGYGFNRGFEDGGNFEDQFTREGIDVKYGLDEELTIVPTTYAEPAIISLLDGDYQAANASFPIRQSCHRALFVNFEGLEGKVIISRSDVQSEDAEESRVEIVVESSWVGEISGVEMKSGEHVDSLEISSSDAAHIVHFILPAGKNRVSSLSLFSTKSLNFEIHPSAEGVEIDDLSIRSAVGDINLPSFSGGGVTLETVTGKIEGTFNVSKVLLLKTITGDIDATVNVVPLFPHGPHSPKNGSFPHPPRPPHGPHKKENEKRDNEDLERDALELDSGDDEEHEKPSWWDILRPKGPKGEKPEGPKDRKPEGPKGPDDKKPKGPGGPSGPHLPAGKGPKGPGGPKGPKGPGGPHHPPPPPPVIIHAFTSTGAIDLTIAHQPPFVSADIKAFSHTGDVAVKAAKPFHGFYEVGTFKGSYEVSVPDWKSEKVLEEVVGETGGLKKGLVFPTSHNQTHNHSRPDFDEEIRPFAEDDHDAAPLNDEKESAFEKRQFEDDFESNVEQTDGDFEDINHGPGSPPPPHGEVPDGPSHKGPGGPPPPPGKGKGPEEPPHKGPGGSLPSGKGPKGPGGPGGPEEPSHKGPGGPPPPPPGKGPKGPGGPRPPPPPGKGPKVPGGPPAHHRPPPPGHSKLIAHTDVGNVKVIL